MDAFNPTFLNLSIISNRYAKTGFLFCAWQIGKIDMIIPVLFTATLPCAFWYWKEENPGSQSEMADLAIISIFLQQPFTAYGTTDVSVI